jgi:separase
MRKTLATAAGALETSRRSPDSHVVLILDKELQCFPWESLPILREASVSRLPTISILRDILVAAGSAGPLQPAFHIDDSKVYYVLNPGGDLISTQNCFQGILTG